MLKVRYGLATGGHALSDTTSTVVIYTGIAPRWIAFIGYLSASVLLIGSYYIGWSFAVFLVWVLLISVYILVDNLRGR